MGKKTSDQKWAQTLYRARELKSSSVADQFERVKLLCELHDDREYREHCDYHDLVMEDELDAEVCDFCQSFLTVRAVYLANPTVEPWLNHGFIYLAHELADSKRKPREPGVSYKAKYLAATKEIERLRAELETLKESLILVGTGQRKR